MVGLTRVLPAARQSYALARQLGYRSISSNSYVWRSGDNVSRTGFLSVGIRREDKSRWERRSPLTPEAVKDLIEQTGAQVYIQPSTKRIFTDNAYVKAGATLTEDLSPADVILGIKEVPTSKLLPGKTYVFFSHTHKGKKENMPMLKDILDKKIRLIDYELIKDPESGKRLVAFGRFAGNAGMVDGLHGMAHRFLGLGYNMPLMYLSMAHSYRSVASAKLAVRKAGNLIEEEGTPSDFGPLVFGFTGSGNVAQGALEIFKELPHEFVPAEDLPKLVKDKNPRLKKVYGVQLETKDYIRYKTGAPLASHHDYLANPSNYESCFSEKIAPYVNSVVTGAYWDQRYPRLMSNEDLAQFQRLQKQGSIDKGKMMSLVDIVCDPRGAFECLSRTTNIEDGFYYYDAIKNVEHQNVEKDGIQVMGIDILPAELPIESSEHFSQVLYPFIKDLIHPSANDFKNLPSVLANATIADNGKLLGEHSSINSHIAQQKEKQTVLLLGSGMVARPLVQHLLRRSNVRVVIASNALSEAESLAAQCQAANNQEGGETEAVQLDISDKEKLGNLVSGADVVVSLVPAFLHDTVAKTCIDHRKHMVTASYVSPEMEKLDDDAKRAGITIMNEVGLDPGIDHMSAMKIIDNAKAHGKKVRSFVSWCGGLPAPEASNVPLGYKFSWSPRGVLTASGNDAVYWADGKQHNIAGVDLLKQHFPSVRTPFQGFTFEGLANRDSLKYTDIYGLGNLNDMDTMFRGTLRYQGYSDLLYAFRKLGFLSLKEDFTSLVSSWGKHANDVLAGDKKALAHMLHLDQDNPVIDRTVDAIRFLFASGVPDNMYKAPTSLDAFSIILANRLAYKPGERDMTAMQHEFVIEDRVTNKTETVISTLIDYGVPNGETAMAKTVGLPAAMATELILDNKIHDRGVLRPIAPDVYLPILDQLEEQGVRFVEQTIEGHRRPLSDATGSGLWAA
ncbi:alpha-aminoadipic semialdehyde mitochondrial [Lichtheimia corymbifera JMRC:FSU:9682]|uniref:Alpha-aminoadipic semialdehyde mitochondrial n=1 Tax=Lichtheimia corymbifera JMRC:FSU:9682 TaxID=1263082 RepID=A0A068S6D2_9FUNG|nr:alpha-aminoadipic semialdehyde mitochondrial [Lichtheimia corymbifera JMRC:FSU:9682]